MILSLVTLRFVSLLLGTAGEERDDGACFVRQSVVQALACSGAESYASRRQSLPRGKAAGSAMCFPLFTSVGNVLESIMLSLEMFYFLDAPILIDTSTYPDFSAFIEEGAIPWRASRPEYQVRGAPLPANADEQRPCENLWCESKICPNTLAEEPHLTTYRFKDGGWLQLSVADQANLALKVHRTEAEVDALMSKVTHARMVRAKVAQAARASPHSRFARAQVRDAWELS